MKEQFKEITFRNKSFVMIDQANSIIEEYQADGLTLTLRQLYYQFVIRNFFENSQRSYDNLGRTISNARLAGLVDWDAIEDRLRFRRGNINWSSPSEMIRHYARRYTIDMWHNQPNRLEVWIEKDALIGVVEQVCLKNDVDYFACRGYVSQSAQYEAGQRMERYYNEGKRPIVIHMGDHDPSGIDMTRDNDDRLCMFSGASCEVRRIALNYDQVEQYKPPPNPAKLTDSRAKDYIRNHGRSSWELDALEPRVLQKLVQDTIDEYKEPEPWSERVKLHKQHKRQLANIVAELDKK